MSASSTARATVMDVTPVVAPTDTILEQQLPVIYGSFKIQGLPAACNLWAHSNSFMTAPKCEGEKGIELSPEDI